MFVPQEGEYLEAYLSAGDLALRSFIPRQLHRGGKVGDWQNRWAQERPRRILVEPPFLAIRGVGIAGNHTSIFRYRKKAAPPIRY